MTGKEFKTIYGKVIARYPQFAQEDSALKDFANNLFRLPGVETITIKEYWELAKFCADNKGKSISNILNQSKLAERREAKGLTQAELAKRAGVKQNQVSNWESGRNTPRAEALKQIAAVLECSIDDLV